MKALNKFIHFLQRSFRIFGDAAVGTYKSSTERTKELREALFNNSELQIKDKDQLIRDRKRIESDMRRAYTKIILNHG